MIVIWNVSPVCEHSYNVGGWHGWRWGVGGCYRSSFHSRRTLGGNICGPPWMGCAVLLLREPIGKLIFKIIAILCLLSSELTHVWSPPCLYLCVMCYVSLTPLVGCQHRSPKGRDNWICHPSDTGGEVSGVTHTMSCEFKHWIWNSSATFTWTHPPMRKHTHTYAHTHTMITIMQGATCYFLPRPYQVLLVAPSHQLYWHCLFYVTIEDTSGGQV